MKKNLGSSDRFIRIAIAAVLGALYFSGTITGTWGIVLLVVGAVFLVTSFIGWCPIYKALGLSTANKLLHE